MRRIVRIAIPIAVIILVFSFALPKIADLSDVWKEIADMSWRELARLLFASLWSLIAYWLVMLVGLPGSTFWQAIKVNQASTAVANTLPGGGALGMGVTYEMYANYGFTNQEISLQILITGIWNTLVKLGMPVIALVLLAMGGNLDGGLVIAAVVGVSILIVTLGAFTSVLYSEELASYVGNKLQPAVSWVRKVTRREAKVSFVESTLRFRRDALTLLRSRWIWLTVATIASHLSLFIVLLLALRNVGVSVAEVSWEEALAAFAFVRLISAIPITPGGLGIVELGAAGALVAAGGEEVEVVAAVLVYRALTYLLPIPLGLASYLAWRHGSTSRRAALDARND